MRQHYTLVTSLVLALLGSNVNCAWAQDMPWLSALSMCGCPDCTSNVFHSLAGGYSCLERIQYLIFSENLTEEKACTRVGQEYPKICGSCNSAACRSDGEPQRIPVSAVENNVQSTAVENNVQSPAVQNDSNNNHHCGCQSCTDAIFNSDANGHPFSTRVAYLTGAYPSEYPTEEDACRQLAQNEFPNQFRQCDPERCNENTNTSANT